jgi:hypothetical protein
LLKCIHVHTYGAADRTGRISGFKRAVRKVCPDTKYVHCVLQTEHFIFQKTGSELNEVLCSCVYIANCVKTQGVNSRVVSINTGSWVPSMKLYFVIPKYEGFLMERF